MDERLSMDRIEAAWESIYLIVDGALEQTGTFDLSDAETHQVIVKMAALSIAHVAGGMMVLAGEEVDPPASPVVVLAWVDKAIEAIRGEITFQYASKLARSAAGVPGNG